MRLLAILIFALTLSIAFASRGSAMWGAYGGSGSSVGTCCEVVIQLLPAEKLEAGKAVVSSLDALDDQTLRIMSQMREDDICGAFDCHQLEPVFVKALASGTLQDRQSERELFWTRVTAIGAVLAVVPFSVLFGRMFARRSPKTT